MAAAEQMLPESIFPLRLIDVQGTLRSNGGLCFHSQPKDWDFYTISHTWSRAIKNLSEYIGNQILQRNSSVSQGTAESMREYNQAFENADLCSNEGYLDLRKFLEVLMEEEGVKENPRIWFDVLCINQQDKNEKDREIRRMAAYYEHSKACYVLTHGVGQGYHLWPRPQTHDHDEDGIGMALPRWFTRVWTLQEFILPKKLMFLVGELGESTERWANQYIETHGPRLCDCWLSSSSLDEATKILVWRELHWGEFRESELRESLAQLSSVLARSRTFLSLVLRFVIFLLHIFLILISKLRLRGGIAHIADYCARHGRQVNAMQIRDLKSSGGRGADVSCACGSKCKPVKAHGAINFVESAAYFVLLVMDAQDVGSPQFISAMKRHVLAELKRMLRLRQMKLQLAAEGEGFAAILEALDQRECTVEEDRVLSIMGLLGVQDSGEMKQLRTGKSLKEQMVQVARLMPRDKLIKLVVASSDRPHSFDGMSWAPVLSRNPLAGNGRYHVTSLRDPEVAYQIPGVRPSVHVLDVSERGLLHLQGKLVHARLIPDPCTVTGHLGTVGAGVTPHLPYCGGCGHIHVAPHAIMRFRPPYSKHFGALPCTNCFEVASVSAPKVYEFYHAMAQYDLEVDGRTLDVPIRFAAHYFTNAYTMFWRGCDCHGAYIQLPISIFRKFDQLFTVSRLQQTAIPRKIKISHGPFQYFVPIDVSLLLLGSACGGKRRVAMVCIGEQHRLHRIGLFHFPVEVGDAIFANTPDTTHCSVGSVDLNLFIEKMFLLGKA